MPLITWIIIFVVTLTTLILAADFFIRASERIGLALGVPAFIIGVTLVAVGTSLPELLTSVVAVLDKSSGIVLGNVIGSNIANICLVLGLLSILAKRVDFEFDLMRVDMPLLMGATILLALACLDDTFSRVEGFICLAGLGIYLAYIVSAGRTSRANRALKEEERPRFNIRDVLILVVTATVIYFSARYNVKSIVGISDALQIGSEVIALSAVALGTSLPELVVSIMAVRTGKSEMAIGNILGSNIFNIFAVMGIPSLFGVIEVPESIRDFSVPALVLITLLFFFVLRDKVVNRWEGLVLLLTYIFVIYSIFAGNF